MGIQQNFSTYNEFNPSSGTATYNSLIIEGLYNTTGTYSGIIRGLYYNPITTSLTGASHRAIETTSGNVLIGTTSGSLGVGANTTINSNSILDVTSTSKGMLPPRMTTAQRDAVTWVAGDAGMMIYNTTTNKHQGWNGTTWNDFY